MTTPNSPVGRVDMRTQMPNAARIIDEKRKELGVAYVNGCIRRGLAGEPGAFLAVEAGHVLGTPFPPGHPYEEWQAKSVIWAMGAAVFLPIQDGAQP